MKNIRFDYTKAMDKSVVDAFKNEISDAHNKIHNKTGEGSDFLGWVDLPEYYDRKNSTELRRLQIKSEMILMF